MLDQSGDRRQSFDGKRFSVNGCRCAFLLINEVMFSLTLVCLCIRLLFSSAVTMVNSMDSMKCTLFNKVQRANNSNSRGTGMCSWGTGHRYFAINNHKLLVIIVINQI